MVQAEIRSSLYNEVDRLCFLLVEHTARRDGENSETDTWLDYAKDCGYLKEEDYARLSEKCREVGKMLGGMLKEPSSFLIK